MMKKMTIRPTTIAIEINSSIKKKKANVIEVGSYGKGWLVEVEIVSDSEPANFTKRSDDETKR